MTPKKAVVRIAVVGAGSIGREFALRHFGPQTHTVVTSVVDANSSAAERLAIDIGSVAAGAAVADGGRYRETASDRRGSPVDYDVSLTDSILRGCDAVYVGTTPGSHRDLVLRALAHGKHVLLEKPLASTGEDADALVDAAEAAARRGLHTQMNIGMRYNAAISELRRVAVEARELGGLRSGWLGLHFARWPREWQQVGWCAGREEGGPLREVGTHFFFAIHEVFGHGCVRRVRVTVGYPPAGAAAVDDGMRPAEETASGTLELEDGMRIALEVTTDGSVSGKEDVYELGVTGDDGAVVCDRFTALRSLGDDGKTLVPSGTYGRTECVDAFVEAIMSKQNTNEEYGGAVAGDRAKLTPVSTREGRNAQRVLDAILRSGGEWIQVTYD